MQWVQQQSQRAGEFDFGDDSSSSHDECAQQSEQPSSASQQSWPSASGSCYLAGSAANDDLIEYARKLERDLEEKSRDLEDKSRNLDEKSRKLEEKSRKCDLLEAAMREERRKRDVVEAAAKASLAREEALRETVQALQVHDPEAHTLWKSQGAKLRAQERYAELRRRRCRALRQQLLRKQRAEKNSVVQGYTRIAQEKLMSLCEPGGKQLLRMDSVAGEGAKAADQPGVEPGGSKRRWKTSKFAGKNVLLKIPSSFTSRIGVDGAYIGGLESNPSRLVAMVLNWCQHNLSIRAASRAAAFEMAMMQEEVHVCAELHKGQTGAMRRSFRGNSRNKPLDVFGNYCAATLTEAIHAFNMTVDRRASQQILGAHGIHIALDISTFGTCHMQSLYHFAFRVEEIGKDAAGNPVFAIRFIEGFGPAIAVGEKLTRQFHDEGGNLFATSTPRAAALSLALANLTGVIEHPCTSIGVDGGGEGAGSEDSSSMGNSRANLNGLGSYRNEIFVSRQAFGNANDKHGEILRRYMDLNQVPEDKRLLTEPRAPPRTLAPVTKFASCPGVLHMRTRQTEYTRKKPMWTDDEPATENIPSRPSLDTDPLTCMAMVKGGVSIVFRCLKHLGHTLALHSCKTIMPFTRELASVILAINNVWILTRLRVVIMKVFEVPGCGPISKMQAETARRLRELDPSLYAEVQARYKDSKAFSRVTEACVTRWGALGKGSDDVAIRTPEFAVCMVLTFSEGLEENRIAAAVSVWSKGGFCHNGLIRLSPKIGRVVFRMNDPGFVFGTILHAFFHKFVHGALQTGSSYSKESSTQVMGGVNSLLRRVHFFLVRGMWLMCPMNRPKTTKSECIAGRHLIGRTARLHALVQYMPEIMPGMIIHRSKKENNSASAEWETRCLLQWKGMLTAKPRHGMLMLNVAVCRPRKGGMTPLIQHWYGESFRENMVGALENLANLIHQLSLKRFDEPRNVLPKGLIRSLCSGPQDYPHQKKAVMIKCLAVIASQTAKELTNTFNPVLFDPHMFLGSICKTDRVPVTQLDDTNREPSMYYVASDVSLANAACLFGQMKEIAQGYAPQLGDGERLGDFLHGPLRVLSLDQKAQEELGAFRKAKQVVLRPHWAEDGSYKRAADKNGFIFRPKPFSAFPNLAKIVLQCSAQPRTNQKVEGGFSLASMAFRCYRRNQGPEMWSETIRKKNVFNLGIGKDVLSKDFIKCFAETLLFRRRNRLQLKMCYMPDATETEEKYSARMLEDMPQYVKNGGTYNVTNICDAPENNKDVLKGRDRNGGRKQNSRHRDGDEQDGDPDLIRAPGPRRKLPAPQSLAPPSRWTLESLNKETYQILQEMCRVQELKVVPCGNGKRCTKADYVAALLADQDSPHESSDTQRDGPSEDPSSDVGDEGNCELNCAFEAEQLDSEQIDHAAPEPSAQAAFVDGSQAVTATAGLISGLNQDNNASLEEELRDYMRDCENNDENPYDLDVEVDPSELQTFDQEMKSNVTDMGPVSEISGSGLEEVEVHAMARHNDDALEKIKQRKIGVWKREYADAFAASSSLKPSTVVNKKRTVRGAPLRVVELGTPLTSVTLQRSDGHQFMVNTTGCAFFLLCSPAGLELVKVTAIFHPMGGEGNEQPVWIEYCRVLNSSDASQVCDRRDNLVQTIENSDGDTFWSASAGSKQIELELAERARDKKSELYHWGDVFHFANAAGLIGGVYWVSRSNETDMLSDSAFRASLLKGVKDKFPIVHLNEMDFVVVGSCFSDSKD